jgi:hypothetical protein
MPTAQEGAECQTWRHIVLRQVFEPHSNDPSLHLASLQVGSPPIVRTHENRSQHGLLILSHCNVSKARKDADLGGRKTEVAAVALGAINSPKYRVAARRFVRDADLGRKSFVVNDPVAA